MSSRSAKAAKSQSRRPILFWNPLNSWWREFYTQNKRKPKREEVQGWFESNFETEWPDARSRPSWEEAKLHAKCLRPSEYVRQYFRDYRARKASGAGPLPRSRKGKKRASQSGTDSEEDEGEMEREMEREQQEGDAYAQLTVNGPKTKNISRNHSAVPNFILPTGFPNHPNPTQYLPTLTLRDRTGSFALSDRTTSLPAQRSMSQRSSQPFSPFNIKIDGTTGLALPAASHPGSLINQSAADGSFTALNIKRESSESAPWNHVPLVAYPPPGPPNATPLATYYEEGLASRARSQVAVNPKHRQELSRSRSRMLIDSNDAPLVAPPWSVSADGLGHPLRTRATVDIDKMSSSERSGSTSADAGGEVPNSSGRSKPANGNTLQSSISNPFASAASLPSEALPCPLASRGLSNEGLTFNPSMIASLAATATRTSQMRQDEARMREESFRLHNMTQQYHHQPNQNQSSLFFKSFARPPLSAAASEVARAASLPINHLNIASPAGEKGALYSMYNEFAASPERPIPAPRSGPATQRALDLSHQIMDAERGSKQSRHSHSSANDAHDMAWINEHMLGPVEEEEVLIDNLLNTCTGIQGTNQWDYAHLD